MYEYIQGKLIDIENEIAIIDVAGIGYQILIPQNGPHTTTTIGDTIKLFTSLVVREDSQRLFGFPTREMRSFFLTLSSVSGIGPKTALTILSTFELTHLQYAIFHSDIKVLTKIPGIGKRTAERLTLELKDKMPKNIALDTEETTSSTYLDALSALTNLGYSSHKSKATLDTIFKKDSTSKELSSILSSALKLIN